MKNIVFFDLDNTIVNCYSQKCLIKYLYKNKIINIFFLCYIYFWFILYKLKIAKNPRKVMEHSLSFFKGMSVDRVNSILESFYNEILSKKINSEVLKEVKNHLKEKDDVYLLSNAIFPLVNVVAKKIEITNVFSTELEIIDNIYTGEISGEITYGNNKRKIASRIIGDNEEGLKSFAYADHHSDIPLFEIVDFKIAVNPDGGLLKAAKKNSWKIIYC
ncbi:MAG: HAD-IB family hydrolase [Patescibacteria group bacterium]|jgi:HAD superfamily hydrolase (TIGR01490 family)|nr:HAD-IB family hydrolase [Patescibacteria group bacterium]